MLVAITFARRQPRSPVLTHQHHYQTFRHAHRHHHHQPFERTWRRIGQSSNLSRIESTSRYSVAKNLFPLNRNSADLHLVRRQWLSSGKASSATKISSKPLLRAVIWKEISSRPIEFLSIPCVAAFVGILTNWMGVKMLFYPVEYFGINLKRWEDTPYGLFGWQGVVPTKTGTVAGFGILLLIMLALELSTNESLSSLSENRNHGQASCSNYYR
jgi:hypothetical protein